MARPDQLEGRRPLPTVSEEERVFSESFAKQVREPVDGEGRSLISHFNPPPVLTFFSEIGHSGLEQLASAGLESFPVKILSTDGSELFRKAGIAQRLEKDGLLTDPEEVLPPVMVSLLQEMALRERMGRKFAATQGEVLQDYLGWIEMGFDFLSGQSIKEISSATGVPLMTVWSRLQGRLPRKLSWLATRKREYEGFKGSLAVSRDKLIEILGAIWYRGASAFRASDFWEKLEIDWKSWRAGWGAFSEGCHLVDQQSDRFFPSLTGEERDIVVRGLFEVYGKKRGKGLRLTRVKRKGSETLGQIQEHLARRRVYSSISSQAYAYKKEAGEEEQTFRLFVSSTQLPRFEKWSRGEEVPPGVGSWLKAYFSWIYSRGLSRDEALKDRKELEIQRMEGVDLPSSSAFQQWYRLCQEGRLRVPHRAWPFLDAYGFDRDELGIEAVFQASRFYLRGGEEIVHGGLKERFPFKSLHELVRAFMAIDGLFYQTPSGLTQPGERQKKVDSAINQWRALLDLDDKSLEELLVTKVVQKWYPERCQDEAVLKELPPIPIPDLSEIDPGDTVGMYCAEVAQTPLLSFFQEEALARLIEKGKMAGVILRLADGPLGDDVEERLDLAVKNGREARERLIKANTRLAIGIAAKCMGRGIPFLDLIQEGNIGLLETVGRFDWRRGYRFSTYATWWIRQHINRHLSQFPTAIRTPVYMGDRFKRIGRVAGRLEQELGSPPTDDELIQGLALEMETTQEKAQDLLITARRVRRIISLERPAGDDGEAAFGDFLADMIEDPSEPVIDKELREKIKEVLLTLTPRQAKIIKLRCGLQDGKSYTLEEVGQKFGLTRERIRQLETKALKELRHPRIVRMLRDYDPA